MSLQGHDRLGRFETVQHGLAETTLKVAGHSEQRAEERSERMFDLRWRLASGETLDWEEDEELSALALEAMSESVAATFGPDSRFYLAQHPSYPDQMMLGIAETSAGQRLSVPAFEAWKNAPIAEDLTPMNMTQFLRPDGAWRNCAEDIPGHQGIWRVFPDRSLASSRSEA